MVCRLGAVAACGGCPQVGVVCLADVSLSPAGQSALPRRWALSGVGNNYRISDIWPLRCLFDRLVRWKILLDVADAARSLGERMWLPNACIRTKPPNEWATLDDIDDLGRTGGDARAGQGSTVKPGFPLTPAAVLRVLEEGPLCYVGGCPRDRYPGWPERAEDNLAKMWQANLTEWYEENPAVGDNLKKEENPAVGDNLKKEENPAVGDNLKKEENPAVGDNLKKEETPP
ncbi:hypothetical protein PAPYR_13245 [Paratrimastix pyriformis]|uniref:Uncharacterized protein n=1 Tax=Paratrimastix pyriformis TaxID=342808 RepID=A0ABQ8U2X5_9EUKA|nr:hypothetical protein PAPYR_13245 [Paratrimastix pyriformis]